MIAPRVPLGRRSVIDMKHWMVFWLIRVPSTYEHHVPKPEVTHFLQDMIGEKAGVIF